MATWEKETVLIELRDWTTGSEDTAVHTVQLQPQNQAYPTGAIACSQCTTETHLWRPDSDLDDTLNYWIYIDSSKKGVLISPNASPAIGE